MAQLSADDAAFGGPLLSVDALSERIAQTIMPVTGTETVALAEADGRVLAQDIIAPMPLPPFANSAVDGYAVRHADLAGSGETRLTVAGRIAAGSATGVSAAGQAVRVFTGAPMPDGADTVYMQEDVRVEGDVATLPQGLKTGANARPAGEDIAAGETALPAGRTLRPQDLALAAALGLTELPVRRRLRVALFSTGDELTEPGQRLPPAGIYDSNRILLASLLRRAGAQVDDCGILRDGKAAVSDALAKVANGHDLILTSGGVSTGEEDHVKAAVEAVGRLDLWRIAIKPGRPVAMGAVDNALFVGLPGNPVAVFVTFVYVVKPLLAALTGTAPTPPLAIPARATFSYRKKEGRREYVRVTLSHGADGMMEAARYPREGAGVLTSLTETDGLMELAEVLTHIEPGAVLPVLPYRTLA